MRLRLRLRGAAAFELRDPVEKIHGTEKQLADPSPHRSMIAVYIF
jgi:hypothetical protein